MPRLTLGLATAITLVLCAPLAFADDWIVPHHGRLLGSDNRAVVGAKEVEFGVFTAPTSGTPLWSAQYTVVFDVSGAYAVGLGDTSNGGPALPDTLFDGSPRWLSITVDGTPLLPRLPFGSVPEARFARHALTADTAVTAGNVDCEGCILPAALSGGLTWDKLEPLEADKLPSIPADKLPSIPADKLPSIPADKLPSIPADKLTGVLALENLPQLPLALTAGTLAGDRVESLPASKLTGPLDPERVAAGSLPLAKLAQGPCLDGYVIKWIDAAKVWGCSPDVGSSYAAGAGIALQNGVISIAPGGVTGPLLADGQIGLEKLGGSCGPGQVLERGASGWVCGTDDVGGGGTSGLTQVSVVTPLTGLGTSTSPIGIADGSITGAKVASRAVQPANLAASILPVFARSATTGAPTIRIGGLVRTMPTSTGGWCWTALPLDGSTAPSDVRCDPISKAPVAAAFVASIKQLATNTLVVIASSGSWDLNGAPDPSGGTVPVAELAAFGLHRAVAYSRTTPSTGPGYAAVLLAGTGRAWESLVTTSGQAAQIGGWLTDGAFVASGDLGSVLSSPTTNQPALKVLQDGHLATAAPLEFGSDVTGKAAHAGRIGYGILNAGALDLVGGGSTETQRLVKVSDILDAPSVKAGKLDVSGAARFDGGVAVKAGTALDLGASATLRETNAGKVGYELFTPRALDIVGAGIVQASRRIKLWAEGGLEVAGALDASGAISSGAGLSLQGAMRLDPVGLKSAEVSVVAGTTGGSSQLKLSLPSSSGFGDQIRLEAYGGTHTVCPWGSHTFARGRICMESTVRPATSMDNAIATCSRAGGAHVCTHNEMQAACQWASVNGAWASGVLDPTSATVDASGREGTSLTGFNPFGGKATGWFGDQTGDDSFRTWNVSSCRLNADGPSATRSESYAFRCCF